MIVTAKQLYEKLVIDLKIIGEKGIITFELKNLKINIESRDTVGNLFQEWLSHWMAKEGIELGEVNHSQDFPDFFLNPQDHRKGLLEVKTFDFDKSANFDVAAFLAYRRSLLAHPYRLDSDYLIIGYSMKGHFIEIKNIWLKKVWEITGKSLDWPLKCQVKQGEIFNIRPIKWYDNDNTTFKPLGSALEFINAFDATQRQWARTQRDPDTNTWLTKVKRGYTIATGVELT